MRVTVIIRADFHLVCIDDKLVLCKCMSDIFLVQFGMWLGHWILTIIIASLAEETHCQYCTKTSLLWCVHIRHYSLLVYYLEAQK